MKQLYVSLLVLMLASSISPASAQDKITGLGKFKINQTTISVIGELEKELDVKLKRAEKSSATYGITKASIFELIPDTVTSYNSPSFSQECATARVFFLPSYKIADIQLSDIYLTFNNDKLIEFKCNNTSELSEALKLKYGTPSLETKENDVSCSYTYTGNKLQLKEKSYYETWENGPIKAVALLSSYYSSDCKKRIISVFYVSNPTDTKALYECSKTIRDSRKSRQNTAKKKTLSDL